MRFLVQFDHAWATQQEASHRWSCWRPTQVQSLWHLRSWEPAVCSLRMSLHGTAWMPPHILLCLTLLLLFHLALV
jgi:hypothetical protein